MEKESFNIKIYVFALMIARASSTDAPHEISCKKYDLAMKHVRNHVELKDDYNLLLERSGFVTPHSVFGDQTYDECIDVQVQNAKIHTVGAQIFKRMYDIPVEEYECLAAQCNDLRTLPNQCKKDLTPNANVHSKYRSIDGRGNNWKNPNWGASATPFSRFGSKNYEDGIHTIKKSVTGSDLPNARLLVQEVLAKAVRSPRPSIAFNTLSLLIILFATHDLHYQVPMQPKSVDKEILCCSRDGVNVLPSTLSNSACLPIEISRNDSFYKDGNIGCLNMVRSQVGEFGVQAGEVLNQATSYLDLSLIYGNHESETKQVRLFKNGTFRMGRNNLLPVDSNGKYLKSMYRFVAVPIASIWPALFARNHNHIAERLAILNPHWEDEIIFQEARRINIANFQYNLITTKSIERVFNKPINQSYSDATKVGTFLEFAFTYRAAHYYIPSDMVFRNENYTVTKQMHQSDTIDKIDLLENNFDEVLRGVTLQPVNVGSFSDEILNRIGKDKNGYGIDLISTDIQRGRDHGLPSFVEIRRRCNLIPEINSFDDFELIFNKTNVDLLRKIYKSYEDVEFYVAGLLEAFESVGNPFAGPTFGCIIGETYNNVMGGDIYYYSHPENPYPFTKAQMDAIKKYFLPNIFCTNSGLKETNKLWSFEPHPLNPKVDCKNSPPMDLSAWKDT